LSQTRIRTEPSEAGTKPATGRLQKRSRADRLVLAAIVVGGRLARLVPWPVWRLITLLIALAAMATPRRHVVLANVRHVRFGAPPPAPVAVWLGAQQIANHLRTVVGTLAASVALPDGSLFEAVGFERLVPLLDKRGVVLVAPHGGPYTTLGIMGRQWLVEQGFTGELVVVARMFQPFRSDVVMEWFVETLATANVTIVPVDEEPRKLAALLRKTLQNKGIIVLLVDEPTPTPSVYVPFFDSAIKMPIGPARLARATGAALLPVMASYAPGGRQRLFIQEPVEPAADPATTLAQVAQAFEPLIARRLGQWSMLTPVWADPGPPLPAGQSLAELHLHTPGSDGLWGIDRWVEAARAAGVKVIAVTDHDHLETVRAWKLAHPDDGGQDVAVIPGVELTARGRIVHLAVLFPGVDPADLPTALPKPGTPLPDLVRWARAIPGAIVVLVHPHPFLWKRQLAGLAELGLLPDAIETRFPLVGLRSKALERAAAHYRLATLGGSDAHLAPGQLGGHVTVFPGETVDDLARAIRERRTRAVTTPVAAAVPVSVYLIQSIYSWLLPFRAVPGVEPLRAQLLEEARIGAEAAVAKPAGIAAGVLAGETVRRVA